MAHLFAYGTLMCPQVLFDVALSEHSGEAGTLTDYSRRKVQGQVFPALIDARGSTVAGMLYRDLDAETWARLDRFEGAMYARREVQVVLDSGVTESAEVYVIEAEYMGWVEDDEWVYEQFLDQGLQAFEKGYAGYRAL